MNLFSRKTAANVPLVLAALVASAGALHGQILLKAVGTVYESSQNTGIRGAANIFDGTPVFGSASGNGPGLFDASDNTATGTVDHDTAPIAAFDLGAVYTVGGAGFAQNTFNANSFAGSINIFTLSLAQYNAYIASAPLIASQTTGRAGGLVSPPTAFLSQANLPITDTADANYTQYTLATPLTGEYYVLQFNNSVAGFTGTGAFLGAQEFEFIPVPEPGSLSLLGFGVVVAAFYVRRRLTVSSR